MVYIYSNINDKYLLHIMQQKKKRISIFFFYTIRHDHALTHAKHRSRWIAGRNLSNSNRSFFFILYIYIYMKKYICKDWLEFFHTFFFVVASPQLGAQAFFIFSTHKRRPQKKKKKPS